MGNYRLETIMTEDQVREFVEIPDQTYKLSGLTTVAVDQEGQTVLKVVMVKALGRSSMDFLTQKIRKGETI